MTPRRRARAASAAARRAPLKRCADACVMSVHRPPRRAPTGRVRRESREVHRQSPCPITVFGRFPIASVGDRGKETEITDHAIDARTAERTSCSFHTLRRWSSSAKS